MPLSDARRSKESLRIGLLALPEITGTALTGLHDLFRSVGQVWQMMNGEPPQIGLIEPLIVALQPGPLSSASGLAIVPHTTLDGASELEIVCVPNLLLPLNQPLAGRFDSAVEWLRSRYQAGATLCSACSGSLLIAETGLLDGWEATTYWGYADLFRRLYPKVSLRPERVLVAAGPEQRLITAGGGSSWNDLALFLIARFCGGEYALQTAKAFLLHWHPEGQTPYGTMVRGLQHTDAAIRRAQDWLATNYTCRNPVGDAAGRSGLPDRTFKRRFKAATGLTPIEYIQNLRLEQAKELLESKALPIDDVAYQVGYDDPTFFRRLFGRRIGLTPAAYRRKFGPIRNGTLANPSLR